MQPPKAEKRPKTLELHGDVREDPWFWLRDRDDQAVTAYLKAENAYTAEVMSDTDEFQARLFNELKARIKEDDSSVPAREGEYWYYRRYETGLQYPLYCRRKASLDAPEEIYLDVNLLAQDKPYLQTGIIDNSPDHRYIAYSTDEDGSEKYTIHIKDMETGELLEEAIPNTFYSLEWANDSRTFFYNVLDENLRPRLIYRHKVGTDPGQDVLVYEEEDVRFFCGIDKSESSRFVYLISHGNNMSEVRYVSADSPQEDFKLIEPRAVDHEYDVTDRGDFFLIRTNLKARDFRIVETPIDQPGRDSWQDFLPHQSGRLVEGLTVFARYMVVKTRRGGVPVLTIFDLERDARHDIAFAEDTFETGIGTNREYDTGFLRFEYTSLTTPHTVYDYNMDTRDRTLKKQQEVPDGKFKSENYESRRVLAPAEDGTQIPISLFYRRGTPLDGRAPLYLYGYGAYGSSMPASFSPHRLSFVDRGFVYAIAHIRGGMEMGWDWYENGKLLCKRNTFTDFIACAEYLIAEKYTSPARIIACGGSAGGLLMGAVGNMRPDLFGAVIAHVPFVDIINTMMDDSLPLTTLEYNEWGDPHKKEFYDYIRSYSPYDNVSPQDYPPMLITGGLNDPRVTYWEPAKWCARLRDLKTDTNMLLLKIHMDFGHAGASGRFDYLKEMALDVAFALKALGIEG